MKKTIIFISLASFTFILSAQINLSGAAAQVRSIGATAAGLIGGICGLIGIGRAAYKFSEGSQDAVSSLIMGIVGMVLGQIAAGLL